MIIIQFNGHPDTSEEFRGTFITFKDGRRTTFDGHNMAMRADMYPKRRLMTFKLELIK